MKDLNYICSNMNALSGIPVRLYKNTSRLTNFSVFSLEKDPASIFEDQLLNTTQNVEYLTFDYQIYGIIKHKQYRVVIGPIGQFLTDRKMIEKTAFILGLSERFAINEFVSNFSMVINMPMEAFLRMMCSINLYLNDEKLTLEDISISSEMQKDLSLSIQKSHLLHKYESTDEVPQTPHNFYAFEKTFLHYIEKGEVELLKDFLKKSSPGSYGMVSRNYLRQAKNLFVVSATLASRAAIKGGLEEELTFQLSDYYIQQCEQLSNINGISNLQYHMIIDYATRVKQMYYDKTLSKLVLKSISYIKNNLASIESTESVSHALFVSRSHLSSVFKKETGKTITQFIQIEKINEAKRLLKYTDRSLSAISNYLNFASQSHFNNIFKKISGRTPQVYRIQKEE